MLPASSGCSGSSERQKAAAASSCSSGGSALPSASYSHTHEKAGCLQCRKSRDVCAECLHQRAQGSTAVMPQRAVRQKRERIRTACDRGSSS